MNTDYKQPPVSPAVRATNNGAMPTICTAIVTYQPDPSLAALLSVVAGETENCLLIDNSVDTKAREMVTTLAAEHGCSLIPNSTNTGMARAINDAITWARDRQQTWLLLLDQDTRVISGGELLPPYLTILDAEAETGSIAVIGLATRSAHREGDSWQETDSVVTSGSLIHLDSVTETGGAWNGLFIDGVDTEMCLSLRARGKRILSMAHPAIEHSIGSGRPVNMLGRTLFVNDHPPVRRYYSARNRILIARRHSQPVDWYHYLREDFLAPLLEKSSLAKLRASMLGLRHGFAGRVGLAPALVQKSGLGASKQ
jgi:rhamnosyltransferase